MIAMSKERDIASFNLYTYIPIYLDRLNIFKEIIDNNKYPWLLWITQFLDMSFFKLSGQADNKDFG